MVQRFAASISTEVAASIGTEVAASIGTRGCRLYWYRDCRLYWYRGVTVLLPGWVIWKYIGIVHANSSPWAVGYCPHCQLPMGEKDTIPLLT